MEYFIDFKNYLKIIKEQYEETLKQKKEELLYIKNVLNKEIFNKSSSEYIHHIKIIEKKVTNLERTINKCLKEISYLEKLISSIEQNKIIREIDNINKLCNMTVSAFNHGFIDILGISYIIGSSCVFNNNYQEKNNILKSNRFLISELAKFYNDDGSFRLNGSNKKIKLLYSFLSYNPLIINEISNLYKAFYLSNKKTKNHNHNLLKLQKYYKNGKLITIPEDLHEFMLLLNSCNIDNYERCYIYTLIEKKILDMKNVKQEENIVFLKDKNGGDYFTKDLINMNYNIRNNVVPLLSKINNKYQTSFNRIYLNQINNIKMYNICDEYARIIFVKLEKNFYLILGINYKNQDYNEIIERYINIYKINTKKDKNKTLTLL